MTEPTNADDSAEIETLTAGLVSALLLANEQQYPMPVPVAKNVASMLHAFGWRQTGEQSREVELPGWVMQRVREETTPVPEEPDHHAPQETPRVGTAPTPPSRIAKKNLGVITGGAV